MNPMPKYLMIIPMATKVIPIVVFIYALWAVLKPEQDSQQGVRPKYATIIAWLLISQLLLSQIIIFSSSSIYLIQVDEAQTFVTNILGLSLSVALLKMNRVAVILSAIMFIYSTIGMLLLLVYHASFYAGIFMAIFAATPGLIWRYSWQLKRKGLIH